MTAFWERDQRIVNKIAANSLKLVLALVVAVVGGLWLKGQVIEANRAARQWDCVMHLKQIALALWSYQGKYGSLPPAVVTDAEGKPLHRWRVLILPFLGGEEVYARYDFDEPWNGPHNTRLQAELPDGFADRFHCPDGHSGGTMTNYFAVVGPKTLWPETRCGVIEERMKEALPEVLVIELPDSEINWMEPRDVSVAEAISRLESLSGERGAIHPRGIQYVDTAQRMHVSPKSDGLLLRKLLTTANRD